MAQSVRAYYVVLLIKRDKSEGFRGLLVQIRELKHLRRRRQQDSDLHVRYSFWYISLSFFAKQQREMIKFKVLRRT